MNYDYESAHNTLKSMFWISSLDNTEFLLVVVLFENVVNPKL